MMIKEKENMQNDHCFFSISDNEKIETTSYVTLFDGFIIRYGALSGFRARHSQSPLHAFVMNTSDHNVNWDISTEQGSKNIVMEPYQIFFNPANVPFSRHTDDSLEYLLILIDPDKLLNALPNANKNLTFTQSHSIKDPNIEFIFRLLLSEVQSGNKNGALFIDNIVSLFSLHFINNYSTDKNTHLVKNTDGFTTAEMDDITQYINNNIAENITLDLLAKRLGSNKFKLIKKFKKSANMTPYQFILKKKLERSKELLKANDIPLIDIALILNFSDQSHFSNAFKKVFGLSPKEFRKTFI